VTIPSMDLSGDLGGSEGDGEGPDEAPIGDRRSNGLRRRTRLPARCIVDAGEARAEAAGRAFDQPPSAEVYAGFRAGDERCVPEVFLYWYGRLVGYVTQSFGLPVDDAKDAAQNAFVRAFRIHGQCPSEVSVPARLFAIVQSEALEHLKRQRRRRTLLEKHGSLVRRPLSVLPDEKLHHQMVFEEIIEALNTMPDRQRMAFYLRRVGGHSYAEIGALLEMHAVEVERTVRRTWRELQQRLGAELTSR
jgi:RNA polymerase sigma-70 factor, ECF subfamily